MANFKTHFATGMAAGVTLNVLKQSIQKARHPTRQLDWGEMLLWGAAGAAAASLPDLLEPALSPNHRGFFHSLAVGGLILFAIFGRPSKRLSEEARHYVALTGFGYLSHLALDIITPMGLPIA